MCYITCYNEGTIKNNFKGVFDNENCFLVSSRQIY